MRARPQPTLHVGYLGCRLESGSDVGGPARFDHKSPESGTVCVQRVIFVSWIHELTVVSQRHAFLMHAFLVFSSANPS